MNICRKTVPLMLFGIFVTLLLSVEADAAIEFYVVSNDVNQKINCDFLEIKDEQALCTANKLLISYNLSRIQTIEVVNRGVSSNYLLFTEETRKIINALNSEKRNDRKGNQQVKGKQSNFDFFNLAKQFLSYFKYQENSSVVSIVLLISGLVVFLTGNIGFLAAAFRAGIFWGISTMLLPVVSFVFLFVHWKTAVKPFSVILLGIAIVFLSTFFAPATRNARSISKLTSSIGYGKVRKKKSNFQCNGKIYCSEMRSCAEATFYLHNCPGTKMDGDHDGIPCERQLCTH